ncbi:MAG: DNA ligase D [Anaeromyxobacteraceae bacterium]
MAVPPYRAQLATLVHEPPRGADWIHEIKYDGYRIGCSIERGRVRLLSRRGNDWTANFPEIVDACRGLAVTEALLDGEAAVVLANGRTSFQALQNAFGGSPRRGLSYFAFDLLWVDGEDVGRRTLDERKARLRRLIEGSRGDVLRFAEHFEGEGPDVFREACRLGLEGVVSKRRADPYRPGRHPSWTKAKCLLTQELVIGGFTDMEGTRNTLGAMLAGTYEGDRLVFAGKVGTGWTMEVGRSLREELDRREVPDCPFTPRPPGWLGKHAHWVRPELVASVAFTQWTTDGMLRSPTFRGLREDRDPREIVREVPSTSPASTPSLPVPQAATTRRRTRKPTAEIAGVRMTYPDRLVYPDAGLTKRDVARYYEDVAEWMLPHVRGRPLTLVHCPAGVAGECRYMKHSKLWAPEAVRRVRIAEKTKTGEYLVIDDAAALLSVVQMDVLEIHTWNSTTDRLEQPDRLVLDLDPGPEVRWLDVAGAARTLRDALLALGLDSAVKTTGGAGLHVVVPLAPERDWTECLAFSRALAAALVRHDPRLFTVNYVRKGREKKILLDYLRNNRTNTSVAAFSTRARAAATVSVPLAWDELGARLRPDRFTVKTLARRLRLLGADPWATYWTSGQRISVAALRAVSAVASIPPGSR